MAVEDQYRAELFDRPFVTTVILWVSLRILVSRELRLAATTGSAAVS
jgi:hypothetical protein